MKTLITLLLIACFVPSNAQTSWKKLETGYNLYFDFCQFSDENHGIVGTSHWYTHQPNDSLLLTKDGGNTWTILDIRLIVGMYPIDSIINIRYVTPSNIPKGLLYVECSVSYKKNDSLYNPKFFLVSYNGGVSWKLLQAPIQGQSFKIYPQSHSTFLGVRDSLFIIDPLQRGNTYIYYISTDTGRTWERISTSNTYGGWSQGMEIIPKNSSEIIAAYWGNHNYVGPTLYSSSDNGKSWLLIGTAPRIERLTGIDIGNSPKKLLIHYLYSNTIVYGDYISSDGGITWLKIYPSGDFTGIYCQSGLCFGFVWPSSDKPRRNLEFSRDGGYAWQTIPDSLPDEYIYDIAIPSKEVIYVASGAGIVYKSTTGGGLYLSLPNDPYFSMYPNPADQILHWNVLEGTVVVFDALGRNVLEVPASSMQADISGLAIGVYYLTIRSGGESVTRVFTVMR